MVKFIILSDCGLLDVNPTQYGEEQCSPQKSGVTVCHAFYLLHYVYSGRGYYRANHQMYTVTSGQIFIIHPHETVQYEPDPEDPWHYAWVGFETNLNIAQLQEKYVIEAAYAEHIFRSLSATNASMRGREYYISGKILEFLSTLMRPDHVSDRKTFVDAAADYIRQHYTQPLTIDSLAEHLHVSHSYFSTAFRQQMGVSPHQYLMDIRLEHAAALMAEHGYGVSEAAIGAGYSNVYNFSKMFKKKYGVSPSRYAADRKTSH